MTDHLTCPMCQGHLDVVESESVESDGLYWVKVWVECPTCTEILCMSIDMPPETSVKYDPIQPKHVLTN